MADTQTGNMLFLEIQEGKEAMEKKRYCNKYPNQWLLFSGEFLHGWGHVFMETMLLHLLPPVLLC